MYIQEMLKTDPKIDYVEDMGGFNSLPTPNRESTFEKFYKEFTIFSPIYTDYKQVFEGMTLTGSYHIYFYSTHAFAVDWDRNDPNKSKVYEIGCEHEWEIVNTGIRCLHKSVCKKCGCIHEVDSSD